MCEELHEYEDKMCEYYPCMDIECEYDDDNMTIYSDVCIPGIESGIFFMYANISIDGYLHFVLSYDKSIPNVDMNVLMAVNNFNFEQAYFTASVDEYGELNFSHYTSFVDVEDCMDKIQDFLDYFQDDYACIPVITPLLEYATEEMED